MKVRIPINEEFNKLMRGFYKAVEKNTDSVVYEGRYAFELNAENLEMDDESFARFCKAVDVQNGTKRVVDGYLIVTPVRNKSITIRLSNDQLELLKKDAENLDLTASEHARNLILSLAEEYLETKNRA